MRSQIIITACLLPFLWHFSFEQSSLKLNETEKSVLKRELIELDINIRSQASLIAMGDVYSLSQTLVHTSRFTTEESPRTRDSLQSVLAKLKQGGLLVYLTQVHATSKSLQSYLNSTIRAKTAIDWNRVHEQFKVIVANTRSFYLRAGIK